MNIELNFFYLKKPLPYFNRFFNEDEREFPKNLILTSKNATKTLIRKRRAYVRKIQKEEGDKLKKDSRD